MRETWDREPVEVLRPRRDLVLETEGRTEPDGTVVFDAERGPVRRYERRVRIEQTDDGRWMVDQVVDFRADIGPWTVLFVPLIKAALKRLGSQPPWWAPPDVLDRAAGCSLAALGTLAVIAGYLSTLITQTLTFVAEDFAVSEKVQGDALAAVRLGVLLAMGIGVFADRRGRRVALLAAAVLGCLISALTALSGDIVQFAGAQAVARGMSTAMGLLIVVMVAEEMPAGSRAYGVSILSMAGGLGAGLALALLPVLDGSPDRWRLLFLLPLLFLPLIRTTAALLPESRRFVRAHARARFAGHYGRLGLLVASALLAAIFSTPAVQLRNEFLRDEFGFSAAAITAFAVLTMGPGAIGVVIGGRLADVHGKRLVGAIGLGGGTFFTVVQFVTDEAWVLWSSSVVASIVGGLAVPALAVYGPELFPTALRSKANVVITVFGVAGSVVGLVLAGRLAEQWSLGPAIAVLALAPALVVVALIPFYPETAHVELETLNPEDSLPGAPSAIGAPTGM